MILNSLLRVYLSTHKFYVICIFETYLYYDTSHEDANLEIVGYTLIRDDYPSNTKRGGTCIYNTFPCFTIIKYSVLGGMHKF